ncbi:hypothetical protein PR002_g10428 [Phytophthora rubi]|uniref:Uncharacterized protein n=1 Tax=Phytophthora rubi TaxID=129364 RepID=A0A6A3ME16_9STRA|nr:hypothetical protein PR002_g10428 [Phytophthora rubi]
MSPIKFSSKSICTNFFKIVVNDGGQPTDYFRCQCGTLRKQPEARATASCSANVTLFDVRDIFDELIAIYPGVSSYLAADADVGKNTEFEAACVAVLRSGAGELMAELRHLLEPFAVSTDSTAVDDMLQKK